MSESCGVNSGVLRGANCTLKSGKTDSIVNYIKNGDYSIYLGI